MRSMSIRLVKRKSCDLTDEFFLYVGLLRGLGSMYNVPKTILHLHVKTYVHSGPNSSGCDAFAPIAPRKSAPMLCPGVGHKSPGHNPQTKAPGQKPLLNLCDRTPPMEIARVGRKSPPEEKHHHILLHDFMCKNVY